ncbi:hypothetical protein [Lactobacillus sp. CBA3605] [Lactiplantibacillus mudanjiangensis]|uniref:PTS glucose transporter subunit IIA n=1 Tax=Lactiplantibacillus mudanjiangensis TaxID=1296538 RepID=UPI001014C7C8|nr:hypothetical protein [Lactobacillus sp. CBA3605] [Lactiplantibacillus mudanjiangensis]
MMKLFQREHQLQLVAPVGGLVVDIRKSPVKTDAVGFGIEPMVGEIQAPLAGTVTQLSPQNVTIRGTHNCEVTVQLGQPEANVAVNAFSWNVAVGDHVDDSTLLANMDLNALHEANQATTITCIITNQQPSDFEIEKRGLVSQGGVIERCKIRA